MRFQAGAILTRMGRWSRSGHTPTVLAPALIARSDALSAPHTAGDGATALYDAGIVHSTRGAFATNAVVYVRKRFALPSRSQRRRARGSWSQEDVAAQGGVSVQTVPRWRNRGGRHAAYSNEQKEYLYEPFCEDVPPQYHPSAAKPMAQSFKEG
jgi:hypothetical protein